MIGKRVGTMSEERPQNLARPERAQSRRILVVAPRDSDAVFVERLLESQLKEGLVELKAASTQEALDAIASEPFDICLFDSRLGEEELLLFFRTLKARRDHLPVILLAGLDEEDLTVLALQEGASDYLVRGRLHPEMLLRSMRYASELAARSRAFDDLQARYDQLFRENLAGVFELTADWQLKDCNPAFLRMFGYAEKAEAMADPFLPLFLASLRREVEARGFRSPFQLLPEKEVHLLGPFGDPLWVRVRLSSRRGREGEILGMVGSVVDVTEGHLAQEDLDRMRAGTQRLGQSQRLELLGRLVGSVAHDFSNLLTAILGYSELVLGQVERESDVRGYVEEVVRASKQAQGITRQLLDFGRPKPGPQEPLDVNQAVQDLSGMLRRLVGTVEVELAFSDDVPRVGLASWELEQVVTNLVLNAKDAMGEGGKVTVSTAVANMPRQQGAHLYPKGVGALLTVKDRGHGMDRETLSRIFEPFFSTKDPGKGTGLGLATVSEIVRRTGGVVEVASEPGKGTIVEIWLPPAGGAI
jgi:PAS domain S-box-containing protein